MDEKLKEYYNYLEQLRKSGSTNMFGASPYLESRFGLSRKEARDVLSDWMSNYDQLKKELNW